MNALYIKVVSTSIPSYQSTAKQASRDDVPFGDFPQMRVATSTTDERSLGRAVHR